MLGADLREAVADGTARRTPPRWPAWAAPMAYLVASVVIFGPVWRHPGTTLMGGPDAQLLAWWLRWVPHALAHGQSPFFSAWINHPAGVNAMWNTSVPALGILMAPVTAACGPLVSLNLLLVLAPAVSAWAGYGAARALGQSRGAAFLAGLLYGFSTAVLAQAEGGHPFLALAAYPPLVLVLLHRLFTGRITGRRCGVLLGAATGVQLCVGEEVVASSAVLTALSLLCLAVAHRDAARRWATPLGRVVAWTAAVAGAMALVPLTAQFTGRAALAHSVRVPHVSTDVLATVLPPRQVWAHVLLPQGWVSTVQGPAYTEVTAYVGLPVLLILVVGRHRLRRSGLAWAWVPLLISLLLCLGWQVVVGTVPTGVPAPGRLLHDVPLLDGLLVARFSLYLALFAALLMAAWWDDAVARPGSLSSGVRTAAVAGVVLAGLPSLAFGAPRTFAPAAISSGAPLPGLDDGATVAFLPWPTSVDDSAMLWQAVDDFHFRLIGAYGVVRDRSGTGRYGTPPPLLAEVAHTIASGGSTPPPGSPVANELAREVAQLPAAAIVVGPSGNAKAVAAYVADLVGRPAVLTGGLYVVRLSPSPRPPP